MIAIILFYFIYGINSSIDLDQTPVNNMANRLEFAPYFIAIVGLLMSEHENFTDPVSKRHLFIALIVLLAMPLLPMLMGWYTALV